MKIIRQLNLNFDKLLLILILMLSGCGQGSSSGQLAGGGQSGTGITRGSISGFGSIYVNGIRFDTAQAQILVEGQDVGMGDAAARDHLAVGQYVRVQGVISDDNTDSVAHKVYYDKGLEGPVSRIQYLDPYTLKLTILGQDVIADNNTTWEGVDADGLMLDLILEVSGHLNGNGTLMATYVALKNDTMTLTVRGGIAGLNVTEETFRINGLTVNFSATTGIIPQLNEGDLVRVEGALTEDDIFEAAELTLWDPIGEPYAAVRPAVVSGIVNHFESEQNFFVSHYPVTTDEQTIFEGITADQLADGMSIMVTGTLIDGILNADTIQADAYFVFQHGTVQTIDSANGTIILAEAPTVLIRISSATRISGLVNTLEALTQGDQVMARGWHRPDDSISAVDLFVFPSFSTIP